MTYIITIVKSLKISAGKPVTDESIVTVQVLIEILINCQLHTDGKLSQPFPIDCTLVGILIIYRQRPLLLQTIPPIAKH